MTQQEKDGFHEWLKANFTLLTNRSVELIVEYVDKNFATSEPQKTDNYFYDDENPDQIKQSIEEI